MPQRPALLHIEESQEAGDARVAITLSWQDREFLGEATGSGEASARTRLLGEATLRAVEALSPAAGPLALDAIASTNLGNSRLAMAQIHTNSGESLVGSALIRDQEPSAAPVRAVLDAINRKLELVLWAAG